MATLLVKDTSSYIASANGAYTDDLSGRALPSMPGMECDVEERTLQSRGYNYVQATGPIRNPYALSGILTSRAEALRKVFQDVDGTGDKAFRSLVTVGSALAVMGDFVCTSAPYVADGSLTILNAETASRGSLLIADGFLDTSNRDSGNDFAIGSFVASEGMEIGALIWKTVGGVTIGDGHKIDLMFDDAGSTNDYTAQITIPTGAFDDEASFYLWRGVLTIAGSGARVPSGGLSGSLIVRNENRSSTYDVAAAPNLWFAGVPLTLE